MSAVSTRARINSVTSVELEEGIIWEEIMVSRLNGDKDRKIPIVRRDRYNVVQIGMRVTRETEKQLKEANRRIEEGLGRRFGYNKVIDELVAYAIDDYMTVKMAQIYS